MTLEAQLPPFTKLVRCPQCEGTRKEPCPSCKGKRWKRERDGYSMILCPVCIGFGRVPCTWCSGEGRIIAGTTDGKYAKKIVIGGHNERP